MQIGADSAPPPSPLEADAILTSSANAVSSLLRRTNASKSSSRFLFLRFAVGLPSTRSSSGLGDGDNVLLLVWTEKANGVMNDLRITIYSGSEVAQSPFG